MGAEYTNVITVYGRTPLSKDEWITAIRMVYPDEDPNVVEKRVRAMVKHGNESLENFIRRAIAESRGAEWNEAQAVRELIAVCYKPDVEYLNRPPVPRTRLELLEKARQRDRETSVGRDPPNATGKVKPTNTGREDGSSAAAKKPATTSSTSAAATASQGAPTASVDTSAGTAGNNPNRGGQRNRKQEFGLAARLAKLEELIVSQQAGQQQSATTRDAARPATSRNTTDQICYHCQQQGHIMRDCPARRCYQCGKHGHIAVNCPLKRRGGQQQAATTSTAAGCQICDRADHSARQCPAFVHTVAPEADAGSRPAGN
jgi:hypothetical protein